MTVTVRPAHAAELAAVGELTVAAYAASGLLLDDDPYVDAPARRGRPRPRGRGLRRRRRGPARPAP